MGKIVKEHDLLRLLERFINDCKHGRRLQKNGKKLSKGTIENYTYLQNHLIEFSKKKFNLRFRDVNKLNKREMIRERNYWKKFYKVFTDFQYHELNLYDNYVGGCIKLLRSFFNYLNIEKGMSIGTFHKNFYVRHEEIPIIVISPERLNFLIYSKEFESNLSEKLNMMKDVFVFGCTVALRVSDLLNLKPANLEYINDRVYLKVKSGKTNAFTLVKLPDYAIEIINKYRSRVYTE